MDYSKHPSDRKTAKLTGAKYYYTGAPCIRGHIALRKTKGVCVECAKEDAARAYLNRTSYFQEYNRRSDVRERRHEWYIDNREDVIARAVSRPAEVVRSYHKTWKGKNPDKVQAQDRKSVV